MADIPSTTEPGAQVVDESRDESGDADASESDKNIIAEAQARIKLAEEAEQTIRAEALDDLKFIKGDQWPIQIQQERLEQRRPCLTVNRLPQFVAQVTNDQRQNRPAIRVHPLDDQASEETAEIIEGLIRHISYNSNADTARDTAFEGAARGGFGYYRIVTEYVGPDSFDQEILVKRIRNQFSVFFDPASQEPDGSDANWAAVVEDLPKDEFKARYPDSELSTTQADWTALGNNLPEWVKDGHARVAEYFYKTYRQGTIHQLSTGETVKDEDLEAHLAKAASAGIQTQVVNSRRAKFTTVNWVKLSPTEVLERTIWPGQYIPIIPVRGNEIYIDGKLTLESVIRHAKDPQRMLNFWRSAETEAIALAPRAPFVGVEGQFEGHTEWKTANTHSHPYLEYRPVSLGGVPAPPPMRQTVEPAVQAITQASMQAADDLKSTTGIYDSAVGAQSNEIAGVAIKARTSQAQIATFHFTDNLTRSMRHEGRIMVDLIPHIYDSARAQRIIGEDGTHKVVQLNQQYADENGKPLLYDMSAGRYDVTLDVGPSYASKRQEAAAAMLDFSRASPQVAQYASDLIAKNMDWPGAQELSERLQKLLPPQMQGDGPMKDVPPQITAQLTQQSQLIKNLTDHLNECTKIIETKKLDLDHRERIEILKLQTESELKMAELGSKGDIALLHAKLKEMEHRLTLLNYSTPIGAPSDFDPQTADGGNYAGIGHIGGTTNLTGEESPGQPVEQEN